MKTNLIYFVHGTTYDNASKKIQELFENDSYFKDTKVKMLYKAMVKYRDKVFPYYVKLNKSIMNDEIVQKIQDFHFNCFDDIYIALKNENTYQKILEDDINKTQNYIKSLIKKLN